ncbi:MAG: hypothetical protein EXR43_05940 [Dehalococcoidia bacterium]|nr:hypothetical protein [Dehalococcoidia bacterium]
MAKTKRIVCIDRATRGNYAGVAVLDDAGRAVEPPMRARLSDDDPLARVWPATIIGIDAILCFPAGIDCFQHEYCVDGRRLAELDLYRLGILCYWTTNSVALTFRQVIERGMERSRRVAAVGLRVAEVYPYGTARRLFAPRIARPHGAAAPVSRATSATSLRASLWAICTPIARTRRSRRTRPCSSSTAKPTRYGRTAMGLSGFPGLPPPGSRSRLDP